MRSLLLLLSLVLVLASCATEHALPPPTAGSLDSAFRASTGLSTGKVKFKGPVTFQVVSGTNNTATSAAMTKPAAPVATGAGQAQDFTKAGQQGGAVATAPGATAGATTRTGLPTWQLVAGGVVVLVLLILGLVYRYRKRLVAMA